MSSKVVLVAYTFFDIYTHEKDVIKLEPFRCNQSVDAMFRQETI